MSGGRKPVSGVLDPEAEAWLGNLRYTTLDMNVTYTAPGIEDFTVEIARRCTKCGRLLGSDRARRLGYGRDCWSHVWPKIAILYASGNSAAAKAADLLELGGLVPLRTHGGRVFRTVSADGTRTYLTAADSCNCTSGLFGHLCHHSVAVTILTTA